MSSVQREQVVATEGTTPDVRPYTRAFFPPRHTPPRIGPTYQVQISDPSELPTLLSSLARSPVVALDTETRGTDYSEPCLCYAPDSRERCKATHIVGMGLAWDTGSVYLPWSEMPSSDKEKVLGALRAHSGLIAHNLYFDGGVMIQEDGAHWRTHPWHACTLALYRLLSNEGWAGQRYGLKEVMTELLLWGETNEEGIDSWLVTHGYYKGNPRVDNSHEYLLSEYQSGGLKANKAEMWRVPHEILGKYCALDAEATYLFYMEYLLPVTRKFPTFWSNFRRDWMYLIQRHIEQKIHGIQMDRKGLEDRRDQLLAHMDDLEREFRTREDVAPHLSEMESEMRKTLADKEPARYKKLPTMPTEPPPTKLDGSISKNWLRWKALVDSGKYTIPIPSKSWENWSERWKAALRGELPEYRFNIQSKPQLSELLYQRLGYPIRILTDTELPGTGSDALSQMGDLGQLLLRRDDALKEVGFLDKYLSIMVGRETIHPSFSIPGTSTGRLSSKEPNLQQVKKTKAMMDLFVARPGCTWIDLDFHALEPTVTTEFSRDENMEAIYGEGARKNDIYLFVAFSVPQWAPALRACGYDPYFPTEEGLARAKKECKHIRKVAKVVTLACAYGAGVEKIYTNLINDGVQITEDEVREVHRGYWELFGQVKTYGYKLQDHWWDTVDLDKRTKDMYKDWSREFRKRDKIPRELVGYILNGLDRPMCITQDYKKDTLNRFVQSTGHDILVRYIHLVGSELTRRSIPWFPLVIDLHDSMTVEVPEMYREETVEVYLDALAELNKELGGRIQLKGTPTWGNNMTAVKEPEDAM